MSTDTGGVADPAATIAAALAQQTAAQKAIAAAEIPLLQQAQTLLDGPEVAELRAQLKPIVAALTPGNSATMLRNLLQFIDGAANAIPVDLSTRQRMAQS